MSSEVVHKPENKTRILSTKRTEGYGKGGGARGLGITSVGSALVRAATRHLHDRLFPNLPFPCVSVVSVDNKNQLNYGLRVDRTPTEFLLMRGSFGYESWFVRL